MVIASSAAARSLHTHSSSKGETERASSYATVVDIRRVAEPRGMRRPTLDSGIFGTHSLTFVHSRRKEVGGEREERDADTETLSRARLASRKKLPTGTGAHGNPEVPIQKRFSFRET